MPCRLDEYRELLSQALNAGYLPCSIPTFWNLIQEGKITPRNKYFVLRHDVDTDPRTAEEMWKIERQLGVCSSYYFRLCTLAPDLMRRIQDSGSEASYHYEELSTLAKQYRLKSASAVRARMEEAKDNFRANLLHLRKLTSLPMKTVAAHGDFMNRKLGVHNQEILTDFALRRELGIKVEVYDEAITRPVTSRHSDGIYPNQWLPLSPLGAIQRGEPVVYLLSHPRAWKANPVENLREDLKRAWEGALNQ